MDAAADRFGLSGTTLAGRYRVERQVAEGGFAVVYRAVQIALDRPIALKVLKTPPGLTDAARARFEHRFATEARTIGKLQHPYIVDVYDYGVSPMPLGDPAPWMALEWLEGETLEHELDRRRGAGGRNVAETVALLRPVIEAVAYAHKRGVVHRDIKPANIMIVDTDTGPMLRMLDFGIAKIMEGDPFGDTRPGRGSGASGFSPDYAAPEQITYSRTGPWTDVHALGLLLTELLTDEPPFSADPRRAAVRADHVGPPADPEQQGRERRWAGEGRRPGARPVAGPALERRGPAARRCRRARRRRRAPAPRVRAASSAPIVDDGDALLASRPWRRARETWRVRRPRDLGHAGVGWAGDSVRVHPAGVGAGVRWIAPARRFGARHVGGQRSAVDRPDPGVRVRGRNRRYEHRAAAHRGPATEPGAAADPHPIRRGRPARRRSRAW